MRKIERKYYLVPKYSWWLPHRIVYQIRMVHGDVYKIIEEELTLAQAQKRLRYWRRR